jgi:peptide methionine sulfoxide reductase MsrB
MRSLSEKEKDVMLNKQMEAPFLNIYYLLEDEGFYHCRACGQILFSSTSKFHSGSGWPCFDRAIENAVDIRFDKESGKHEATCSSCNGFIGYYFEGENFTEKQKRYNISSLALRFKPK